MSPEHLRHFKKWFATEVRAYRDEAEDVRRNIRLKAHHTYRVCAEARDLARSLGVSPSLALLADAAALLHDVGRFEQYRRYHTFNDALSVDHAALGLEILHRARVLVDLPENEARVILDAIAAHNRPHLPVGLNSQTRFVSQLLRDADKLDIWRLMVEHFESSEGTPNRAVVLGLPDSVEVSAVVLQRMREGQPVLRKQLKSVNDLKLFQIGWVYDLNLPPTFRAVRQRRYIERLASGMPTSAEVDDVIRHALEFVVQRSEGSGAGMPS